MTTVPQIQGMLLEEAIIYLLRYCGYQPVMEPGGDPTLQSGSSGLEVKGRGENHQIDAVADFRVPQPFANPSRLLIEAKFNRKPVGIDIVRNAVGVLKDVSEYWATGGQQNRQPPRYHYQYAILGSSGFTKPAQRYAAAQDVYLIPLARSSFFKPILEVIGALKTEENSSRRPISVRLSISLSQLRRQVRSTLINNADVQEFLAADECDSELRAGLHRLLEALRQLEYSVLAVAMNRLPLILTPAPNVHLSELTATVKVRIYWDDQGWYLEEANADRRRLFSFDLPEVLFKRYASENRLTPERALLLKGEALAQIDAFVLRRGRWNFIRFELDQEWIEQVESQLQDSV
jgi:hypothetical protein